jgi:hypothetical protein
MPTGEGMHKRITPEEHAAWQHEAGLVKTLARKGEGRVWTHNWKTLKDAGVTKEQALVVWKMLDDNGSFRYQWLADSAYRQLEDVYHENGS